MYREVLVLRELDELSYKEIASVLEVPIGKASVSAPFPSSTPSA